MSAIVKMDVQWKARIDIGTSRPSLRRFFHLCLLQWINIDPLRHVSFYAVPSRWFVSQFTLYLVLISFPINRHHCSCPSLRVFHSRCFDLYREIPLTMPQMTPKSRFLPEMAVVFSLRRVSHTICGIRHEEIFHGNHFYAVSEVFYSFIPMF